MKIIAGTLVFLAAFLNPGSAYAFQYIQCARTDGEGVNFVLSLGHEQGNTLFVSSPYLYGLKETSDVMQVERLNDTFLKTHWAAADDKFTFKVSLPKKVQDQETSGFNATLVIEEVLDQEQKTKLPMSCFSAIH